MLSREKVEHGLRAAADILGTKDLVLIGSATAVFGEGRYTLRMARSEEIDTYSPDARARSGDELESIGPRTPFFETHGFYVDGVSPDTARMPADWRDRATTVPLKTDPSIRVTVPELNDVALSKLIAWREKDIGWLEDAAMLGRIDPVAMAGRVEAMPLHRVEAPSEELNRRLQVLAPYAGPAAVAALSGLPSAPSGPAPIRAASLGADDRGPVERELKALRSNDLNMRIADTLGAREASSDRLVRYELECGLRIAAAELARRGHVHPNEVLTVALQQLTGKPASVARRPPAAGNDR